MNGKIFPARYTQLDPKALKEELIQRYDLQEPLSCRAFDNGINDIYIVKTESNVYYLRISMTGRHDLIDYEEEVTIINSLGGNGIRVAAPVCCKDGNFVWDILAPEGVRYAVLFQEAKRSPSEDKIKSSYLLGQMAAQIHKIADNNDYKVSRAPIDLSQLAYEPLKVIQPYLEHRAADYEYLKNAAEKLCRYVEVKLSYDKPYYGYCHGDIHSGNVFFEGVKPRIFDFDCMGYGWRAYDVCVYAWNETGGNEKYIESDEWKSFLEGYNDVRRMSEAELDAINVFAALRELWLMGLHADVIERNAGCCWYNDDYFNHRIGVFKKWFERAEAKLI
ncbi:MAG: aminoglycoside phosphotransferase [Herbinix sp.]|jgi:Ser/Thr protein kinase RdoA (MazF antagonist)|nr:aminoglycoside phosphotransferase [Herbinix sp.]